MLEEFDKPTCDIILEHLYLGDKDAADDESILIKYNITHILTVADHISPKYPGKYIYKVIPINDFPCEDIISHFETTKE